MGPELSLPPDVTDTNSSNSKDDSAAAQQKDITTSLQQLTFDDDKQRERLEDFMNRKQRLGDHLADEDFEKKSELGAGNGGQLIGLRRLKMLVAIKIRSSQSTAVPSCAITVPNFFAYH